MDLLETRQTYVSRRCGVAAGVERRMQFLDPVDRKLLELTVGGRVTRREAALLLGRSPGAVTRRMWALLRRFKVPMVAALSV
jgi:hypothetical protein